MRMTLAQALYWTGSTLIVGVTVWRGVPTQRLVSLAVLTSFVASTAVESLTWQGLSWAVALIDITLAVSLFRLSLQGRRWWIHAASAYACANALVHMTALLDGDIWWWGYITSRWVLSGLILASPLLGLWEEPVARRYLEFERARDDHIRSGGGRLDAPQR